MIEDDTTPPYPREYYLGPPIQAVAMDIVNRTRDKKDKENIESINREKKLYTIIKTVINTGTDTHGISRGCFVHPNENCKKYMWSVTESILKSIWHHHP